MLKRLNMSASLNSCVCFNVRFYVINSHLMVNKDVFRFLRQEWKTHCLLYLTDGFLSHFFCSISTCYSLYVSSWAGMNVQFVSKGLRRPTPAGDLQTASLSCGETRTERQKRWNREQRVSLHPQTLLFQAFLIILREEQCTTDKLTWSTHREHYSQLIQEREEKEKSKSWGERVEERRARGDEEPCLQWLYPSLFPWH